MSVRVWPPCCRSSTNALAHARARYLPLATSHSPAPPALALALALAPTVMHGLPRVVARAQVLANFSATVHFHIDSPDASGRVLATVVIHGSAMATSASRDGFRVFNGTAGSVVAPSGVSSVFMVFGAVAPASAPTSTTDGGIGAVIDWFSFSM